MRKLILFLLFIFFSCCSKPAKVFQDTHTPVRNINYQDVYAVTDTIMDEDPRNPPSLNRKLVFKNDNEPLDGFFKIITSKNTYFTSKYNKGKSDTYFNVTKYFYDNKIVSIKYQAEPIIGSSYIYIPDYSCNTDVVGYQMSYCLGCEDISMNGDYDPVYIIDTLSIQQQRKGEVIQWKIKSKSKRLYNLEMSGIREDDCL